jgi:hypothetical protein
MNVALGIVEAEDHGAVTDNLLEALEADYGANCGDFRCWHFHHKSAWRGRQGASCFLSSSALDA